MAQAPATIGPFSILWGMLLTKGDVGSNQVIRSRNVAHRRLSAVLNAGMQAPGEQGTTLIGSESLMSLTPVARCLQAQQRSVRACQLGQGFCGYETVTFSLSSLITLSCAGGAERMSFVNAALEVSKFYTNFSAYQLSGRTAPDSCASLQ